jgi:hypothetical protein
MGDCLPLPTCDCGHRIWEINIYEDNSCGATCGFCWKTYHLEQSGWVYYG